MNAVIKELEQQLDACPITDKEKWIKIYTKIKEQKNFVRWNKTTLSQMNNIEVESE